MPGAGTVGATLDEACAAGAGVLMFDVAPIPPNPTAKATAAAPLKVVNVILLRDFIVSSSRALLLVAEVCC